MLKMRHVGGKQPVMGNISYGVRRIGKMSHNVEFQLTRAVLPLRSDSFGSNPRFNNWLSNESSFLMAAKHRLSGRSNWPWASMFSISSNMCSIKGSFWTFKCYNNRKWHKLVITNAILQGQNVVNILEALTCRRLFIITIPSPTLAWMIFKNDVRLRRSSWLRCFVRTVKAWGL